MYTNQNTLQHFHCDQISFQLDNNYDLMQTRYTFMPTQSPFNFGLISDCDVYIYLSSHFYLKE